MDHTSLKSCPGTSIEHNTILRRNTKQLAEIHSRGEVHGKHGKHPASVPEIIDSAGKFDVSIESLSEWRPVEETKTDSKPTKKGDIFSLGCYFYYVITGGEHPFGRSGQRVLFIENNLYNLAGCRNQQLQTLIARMINYDCTKRPNSFELLNHPFLWDTKKTEDYLINVAEKMDENSDQYEKWKGTILLSEKSIGLNGVQKKTAVKVTNVAAVLKEIKKNKGSSTDFCKMFPNLLPSVYTYSESTGRNETEQEIDESRPEIFNDLLVANGSFGEVQSVTKIKRRHGRLGLQHVHVIQFQKDCDDAATKSDRLRYLSHPNCLQCFYLVENSSEICMAFEPFSETLETWLEKRDRKQLEWEIMNNILRQTTKGIVFYHTNKLTHGNLSLNDIVIFEKGGATIIAKVATFSLSHVKYSETSEATTKNDIQKLGTIFSHLLSKSKLECIPQSHVHLTRAMKELDLPSAASILKHPFLWSPEMTSAFLVAAGDFYVQHPTFDKMSKLEIPLSASLNSIQQNCKTNREALEAFSSQTDILATEEATALAAEWTRKFPELVFHTWLRLQQFKKDFSLDENVDLSPFYHPNYDFPLYDELVCDEKAAINNMAIIKDTPPENYESLSKWSVSASQKESIKNYLNKCVLIQRKKVSKNQASTSSLTMMQHLPIDQFGRTPMHIACQSDDFHKSATALMELGFDPNTKDSNGFVPLHVAAERNAFKIAKLLIEYDAKLDIRDDKYKMTPIFFAAINDSIQIVTLFIKKKAKIDESDLSGRNPLHFAVMNKSLEAARILLKKSADVNAKDNFGNNSLHFAVAINSIEMVKLLLDYKANPNTPIPILPGADNRIGCVLHLAVVKQNIEMVEVLLNAGADPNKTNCHGETALHLAALQRNVGPNLLRIVDLLIAKDAKPNAIDHCNRTVLYAAIFNKAEEIAKRLLELDYSSEVTKLKENDRGFTLLHIAAIHKFENLVATLIAKGALVDAKDNNDLTPLEYAAALDAVNVVERFYESDAKAILRYKTQNIRSLLHVAAAYNALEVGKLLISLGLDINSVDALGLTPLHYATYRNSVRFMNFLKAKHLENSAIALTPEAQKRENPLSKNLSPEDLALIPCLINCCETINSATPNIQINLPAFVEQIINCKITVTQEIVMNFSPCQ